MNELISAELAATCAALGFYDGITYHLDSHCLDVIKDLIKYLKRDDDDHTVRRYLGQSKLLETDLKKIFIQHFSKTELWDVLLRLLINLTSPALLVYNEELPSEKTTRNMYEQLVVHLQGYKVALADDHVWTVVGKRLKNILNMESSERGEENEMIIERILTLIKNVLQVPPSDNEKRADNDASVHDEVLFALHTSGLVDMLLFIASNSMEQQYHMQVLEIIALMLRDQCATKLASVKMERSALEKERDSEKLMILRQKEIREKMEKMKKYAGSRHSRFGGTFVVQNMKAIGDNQLICHKPYQKIEALEFGQEKVKIKKSKKNTPVLDSGTERTSALSVRLFLKEFCVEFLNGAYNSVMRYVRFCIVGGNSGISTDASYYLWTLRFFMEFNRHYKFQVKYVSETISNEIFHLVQREIEQNYEMMLTDKKKIPVWAKRLHLAVKAYQELLNTLGAMDSATDPAVRESSKIIKSNIFYVPEYRETILSQLIHYDPLKMSRNYLIDLVTTAHIFLKMLEQFCSQSRTIIVRKKAKKSRSAGGKKKKKAAKESAREESAKPLVDLWDDAGPEIFAVLKEGIIPQVVPFDATLDTPIDEQKSDAMKKIQVFLRKKNFEEAVGLLRAAREVWPENDCFGKQDIPLEEEFLALREIYFAELGVDIDCPDRHESDASGEDGERDDDDEDEEEERAETAYEETNFKFSDFLSRFANVKVVKAMALLLASYDVNSLQVNHYVAKMLHRIAWDCKMPAMIFQASIFRIFQRILESKSPAHKELQKFAVFILRRFAQVAETNNKAYMELFFWKTAREATEMIDGYDGEPGKNKASRSAWSEAEEDELRTLFMEHQNNNYTQDLVSWILANLIRDDRTRRSLMKKLKEMCLIANSKAIRADRQKKVPQEWGEEEIVQLTELWERMKDDRDPVDVIRDALTVKRPKNKIKEKLLDLGLAKDRKELRKKRRMIGDYVKSSWEAKSASENSDDSENSDTENREPNRTSSTSAAPKKKSTKKGKKQPTIVYSDAQLSGLLKDVIEKDMKEALEWIKESLEEAIEDRDEESSEGIALVPITEESSVAMDSPHFQRLLRAIGIDPPADEQETYWRFPATMLISTMRKRCALIEDALAGNFIPEVTAVVSGDESDTPDKRSDDSDSDDALTSVKKFFKAKELRGATKSKPALIITEDCINGNDVDDTNENNTNDVVQKVNLVSDSENDSVAEVENDPDMVGEIKRTRSQESDTELPLVKKPRVLVIDDESDEDEVTPKATNKGSRKLISDDEED